MPNAFSTVLDGVTITGGNANTVVAGYGTRDLYGGGILLLNLSNSLVTPVLFRVYLIDNQAYNGGGIANFGGTLDGNTLVRVSDPQLTFCQFINNRATRNGGAFYNTGNASPNFTTCGFRQNTAQQSGGGLCNESSSGLTLTISPVLTGCSFESNSATVSGGAIENLSDPRITMQPLLERCRFTDNFSSVSGSGRGGAINNRTSGGWQLPSATVGFTATMPIRAEPYTPAPPLPPATLALICLTAPCRATRRGLAGRFTTKTPAAPQPMICTRSTSSIPFSGATRLRLISVA